MSHLGSEGPLAFPLLGPPWSPFGGILGRRGSLLGRLEAILGASKAVLGHLGPSWCQLGRLRSRLGSHLGRLDAEKSAGEGNSGGRCSRDACGAGSGGSLETMKKQQNHQTSILTRPAVQARWRITISAVVSGNTRSYVE